MCECAYDNFFSLLNVIVRSWPIVAGSSALDFSFFLSDGPTEFYSILPPEVHVWEKARNV